MVNLLLFCPRSKCHAPLESAYVAFCQDCGCFRPGSALAQWLGDRAPRLVCWNCDRVVPPLPVGQIQPSHHNAVLNVPDNCPYGDCNVPQPTTPRQTRLRAFWRTLVFWCLPLLYVLGVRILGLPLLPLPLVPHPETIGNFASLKEFALVVILMGSFADAFLDRCQPTRRARLQAVNLSALFRTARKTNRLLMGAVFVLVVAWFFFLTTITYPLLNAIGLVILLPYLVTAFLLDRYLPLLGLAAFSVYGKNWVHTARKLARVQSAFESAIVTNWPVLLKSLAYITAITVLHYDYNQNLLRSVVYTSGVFVVLWLAGSFVTAVLNFLRLFVWGTVTYNLDARRYGKNAARRMHYGMP